MFEAKTDAQLCGLSAGGSADASTELVRRTQGAVCAVTYAATGRRDTSEDLAQETYLLAWRKLRERRLEEPEKVAAWLCGDDLFQDRIGVRGRLGALLQGGLGAGEGLLGIGPSHLGALTDRRVRGLRRDVDPGLAKVLRQLFDLVEVADGALHEGRVGSPLAPAKALSTEDR